MRYDRAASIRRIRPGAGVGTGFRRDALEKLAAAFQNRIFDPEALTEDYANGLRMFRLGCRQAFVPLFRSRRAKDFVATREYFPKTWRTALRQRCDGSPESRFRVGSNSGGAPRRARSTGCGGTAKA